MRTDAALVRRVVNGPTMGTRYAAVFFAPAALDLAELQRALHRAVTTVDEQMSTWNPQSALMQLNRAPVGAWFGAPSELIHVLESAVEIGHLSDGAFDIGVGDLVTAWGFGPAAGALDPDAIAKAGASPYAPTHLSLEVDRARRRVRKHAPVSFDLSGIAKGYGVDALANVLETHDVWSYLVSIDGELRVGQHKPDGSAWKVALESPVVGRRQAATAIEIARSALATSGDYRHFIERNGTRYAHTMDPRTRRPLTDGPAAVTVRASTCMRADAWATALMVLGPARGRDLAQALDLDVLFVMHRAGRTPVARGALNSR
jgi:thiamine biosynthesis lipoprotein